MGSGIVAFGDGGRYLLLFLHQGSALQVYLPWKEGEEIGQEFLYSPDQGYGSFRGWMFLLAWLTGGPLIPSAAGSRTLVNPLEDLPMGDRTNCLL